MWVASWLALVVVPVAVVKDDGLELFGPVVFFDAEHKCERVVVVVEEGDVQCFFGDHRFSPWWLCAWRVAECWVVHQRSDHQVCLQIRHSHFQDLTVNVPSIETSLRRTLTMGWRFRFRGYGPMRMPWPVVFRMVVSPAGSLPPLSLKVFNGEVSFAVVGDGPFFVGV